MKTFFAAALLMCGLYSTSAFAEGDFLSALFGSRPTQALVPPRDIPDEALQVRISNRSYKANRARHAGRYARRAPRAAGIANPAVHQIVTQAALRHGVPPALAHAVVQIESRYDCRARNRSGAAGLGQLMPRTARGLGVHNPFDCAQNAAGMASYLKQAINRHGYTCAAFSAYNSGLYASRCTGYGRKVMALMSGRSRYASLQD